MQIVVDVELPFQVIYCHDKKTGLWEIGGFYLLGELYLTRPHKMRWNAKCRVITPAPTDDAVQFSGFDFMCQFDTIDDATLEALEGGRYAGIGAHNDVGTGGDDWTIA